MIKRESYINEIKKFMNKPIIKVITGMRRSGKSIILKLISEELINEEVSSNNIIYINFESLMFSELTDFKKLYNYIIEKSQTLQGKIYILLDEIQEVEHWEKAINSFMVDLNCDIYITGSNANLLSSELATYIAGRYVEIKIYPLSFKEYIEFAKIQNPSKILSNEEYFEQYLQFGGLPGIHNFDYEKENIYQYLSDIYNSVLLKDVIARNGIRDIELLERVVLYILDNIGNTFSAKNISDFLKSQGRKLSRETVYNYLKALENAYIISKVQRYDIKGKALLETQEKFYLMDLGLRHSKLGYRANDIAGYLENIIYLELMRRKYTVNIGKLSTKEVDFIGTLRDEKLYIQVTYLLATPETIEREFYPLKNINDNYPKYVLSMDNLERYNIDGIIRERIIDFLLND
ncbi:ATP-binding protein [Fusobacterium mortiferum]|uniref:ATP-binding protein n=1 Tax=Fusobacterium mortiferum TaxID=850 RepID=A0A414PY68_FUSMR|nr:ATP-binding protein [Fusobacterium mortiferum]MCI6382023.1 ATP-binding protein [Fusobacterium mortiferum]RHF73529.1 ATP-binding protein [Fusobacterium mortiferum]